MNSLQFLPFLLPTIAPLEIYESFNFRPSSFCFSFIKSLFFLCFFLFFFINFIHFNDFFIFPQPQTLQNPINQPIKVVFLYGPSNSLSIDAHFPWKQAYKPVFDIMISPIPADLRQFTPFRAMFLHKRYYKLVLIFSPISTFFLKIIANEEFE